MESSILNGIINLKLNDGDEKISEKENRTKINDENGNEEKENLKNSKLENSDLKSLPTEEKPTTISDENTGESKSGDIAKNTDDKTSSTPSTPDRMSPKEFFNSSRLRCSGLAHKLNTTQVFGGSTDLIPGACEKTDDKIGDSEKLDGKFDEKNDQKAVDESSDKAGNVEELTKDFEKVDLKEQKEEKSAEAEEKNELIDRSPLPVYAKNYHAQQSHPYHHPQQLQYSPQQVQYQQPQQMKYYQQQQNREYYQMPPASFLEQQRQKAQANSPCQRQNFYENYCQSTNFNAASTSPLMTSSPQAPPQPPRGNFVDISPPPSVVSDHSSAIDPNYQFANLSPYCQYGLSPAKPSDKTSEPRKAVDESSKEITLDELPDELCDFILTYSRQYAGKTDIATAERDIIDGLKSNPVSPAASQSSGYETASSVTAGRSPGPLSTAGEANLELFSPSSAFYSNSPGVESTKNGQHSPTENCDIWADTARKRLREKIDQKDLDAAWAWAMRCCQSRQEALFFRDKDGDTLLHIVVWHKDLAKIYVLTEIMLKSDNPDGSVGPKLFDLPNGSYETPLYLAVEKGLNEVIGYLLECGADPNIRPNHGDADPPLHYAAARGMSDVVQTLCFSGRCGINVVNTTTGLTPLLCAVKNHGNLDGDSRCMVNNTLVVKTLLETGADPTIADATNGKNILHYCVERMDSSLLQLVSENLDRNVMAQLTNTCDFNSCTAMMALTSTPAADGSDEAMSKQKMMGILMEFSLGQQLSADDFGDLSSFLVPDHSGQSQFTVLDSLVPSVSEAAY